jgi:YHS domain-containing protein
MLNKMLLVLKVSLLLLSTVLVSGSVFAEPLDKPTLEKQVPLALEGYDVITYFNLTGAKLGLDSYQAVYDGKRYLFSNENNQQKFAKDPLRYLPQFDGLCAHSVSIQKDMLANPTIYTLKENKLYMFSNEDARKQWSLDPNKSLLAANKNWNFKAENRTAQLNAKELWKTKTSVKLFRF